MNNIRILPTDKLSKVFEFMGKLMISDEIIPDEGDMNRHIYLTSNRPLSLGEYHFNSKYGDEPQKTTQRDVDSREYWEKDDYVISKIDLTTDLDLISDGVQSVGDEFLAWLVKNPSCMKVRVEISGVRIKKDGIQELMKDEYYQKFPEELPNCVYVDVYKIVIPEVTAESMIQKVAGSLGKSLQETSEIIENFSKDLDKLKQQGRLYSEEDMKQFGLYLGSNFKKLKGKTIDEIFEQFKKE